MALIKCPECGKEFSDKGNMEHKVFIRGADTFPTGEKLLHGNNPPFVFLLFICYFAGGASFFGG